MEFTVFTSAGGFREFPGDSSYRIGEENGVLYVNDGATGQVMAYGPSAWASVQEWQRHAVVVPPAGEQRRPPEPPPIAASPEPAPDERVVAAPRHFDPLTDPLETFAD